MKKIKYYCQKFIYRIFKIFSWNRIKKYGIHFAILDFLIFLMHRNNSKLEHLLIRRKDIIVQRYLYNKYSNILNEIKS